MNSIESPKVFIRYASQLAPAPPATPQIDAQCDCEPNDDCPLELMDFSFATACPYGTVRCCRPPATDATTESQPTTTAPVYETEVLGENQFRPIDLPFLRIPLQQQPLLPVVPQQLAFNQPVTVWQ